MRTKTENDVKEGRMFETWEQEKKKRKETDRAEKRRYKE